MRSHRLSSSFRVRRFSNPFFSRCLALALIFTLTFPPSFAGMGAGTVSAAPTAPAGRLDPADAEPWNRHVFERWNSPERARALEEAARMEAEARAAYAASEDTRGEKRDHDGPSSPPSRSPLITPQQGPQQGVHDRAALASGGSSALQPQSPQAPQSVTEVLFNYAAGFAGVPGLAPRQGIDGSFDEGLGFHQDGTARKAGGVTGASGPSDRGYRARTYMQSGLNAYGQGYAPGLYDDMFADLWGRNDPTRGGRVSGSGMYGGGYSRDFGGFNFQDMLIDNGLNYGAGFVNSMGEAALSGLVDGGRARLNFRLDRDGYFSGEGDALLPFYDSARTTIYTQIGARSMHDSSDTRWIGNFGLGQRWFPLAEGDDHKAVDYDAGQLMLGYNAFFDYDFTRDHQRGGVGAEVWYDWLRLGTNYYFPLSSWKGSEDFDSRFVKERPAEGWDARVKAYLPFYRNVALTGAYSQWYGDHVGMFGADRLEKDPKVWSYGIEYTPIPLVSGFVTQKSTERGRTATEFGLNFTYHFQMPWEQQISHSKVAELRTVGGSRHEFVDRENRIILEYKARNAYQIEFLGRDGARGFLFRIRDGFGEYKAGQTVRVTASGTYLAEAAPAEEPSLFARALNFLDEVISVKAAYAADLSKTYVTDGQGRFWVELDSTAPASVAVTVEAGNNTQTFMLQGGGGSSFAIILVAGTPNPTESTSSVMTAAVTDNGSAVSGKNVVFTWTVKGSSLAPQTGATESTNGSGEASWTLAGDGSRRTITVTATVQGTSVSATADVQFGAALPNGFIALASGGMNWSAAGSYCASQGGKLPRINNSDSWDGSNMSSASIDGFGTYGNSWPSGLPSAYYWTGTESSFFPDDSWIVLASGSVLVGNGIQSNNYSVVCVP